MLQAHAPGDDKPAYKFNDLNEDEFRSKEFQGFRQALMQWSRVTSRTSWRGLVPRTFVVESEFAEYSSALFPEYGLVQKFLDANSLHKIKSDPKLIVFIEVYRMLVRHLEKGHNMFFFSRCDVRASKYSRKCSHCTSLKPLRAVKLFDLLRNNNFLPYTASPSQSHPGHFLTAKESIEVPVHTANRDKYHPTRVMESKFLRCQCGYNAQSLLDLKRHSIIIHPGRKVVQMHICGSNLASGGVCAL